MRNCMSLRGQRPKQSILIEIASLSLAMTVVLVFPGCDILPKTNIACYKDDCFHLELAVTAEEKAKGLQGRDHLDKDIGMLFFMDNRTPQRFWMKETLIPLDMIWLDDFGKILYIEHAAYPCEKDPCPTFGPRFPSAYVLEINGGEAVRLDMRIGDRITLELNNVK